MPTLKDVAWKNAEEWVPHDQIGTLYLSEASFYLEGHCCKIYKANNTSFYNKYIQHPEYRVEQVFYSNSIYKNFDENRDKYTHSIKSVKASVNSCGEFFDKISGSEYYRLQPKTMLNGSAH